MDVQDWKDLAAAIFYAGASIKVSFEIWQYLKKWLNKRKKKKKKRPSKKRR
ncbi:hypothetical protein [Paenibacillus caseinilyticus]|uniref:hypothetical protein n=1 Tax=Paenibacillus caseinilyticus TaxID=3098138 RepID=UPI0022B8EA7C|nr:hypothetical protein [Paenibacillus caseinilyticus]MCZ8518905.1 hypothetical protein [Paenibacillus caseinilyticus]